MSKVLSGFGVTVLGMTVTSSAVGIYSAIYKIPYTMALFFNPISPVSYTHLDVYKRQTHRLYDSYFKKDRALSIVGVNTERGKHLFGNLKNVDFIKADYLKAVSYTHLDVYKRQG